MGIRNLILGLAVMCAACGNPSSSNPTAPPISDRTIESATKADGTCQYSCSKYHYTANQCWEGWQCDAAGKCLTYSGTPGAPDSCAPIKPACQPTTCAAQKTQCGSLSDGCGATLTCGKCQSGSSCQTGQCVQALSDCACDPATGDCDGPDGDGDADDICKYRSCASAPNGTSCGTARVCSSGQCVNCAAGESCVPSNTCRTGVLSCSSGPVCIDSGARPDGTACGTDLICTQGQCISNLPEGPLLGKSVAISAHCWSAWEPCDGPQQAAGPISFDTTQAVMHFDFELSGGDVSGVLSGIDLPFTIGWFHPTYPIRAAMNPPLSANGGTTVSGSTPNYTNDNLSVQLQSFAVTPPQNYLSLKALFLNVPDPVPESGWDNCSQTTEVECDGDYTF